MSGAYPTGEAGTFSSHVRRNLCSRLARGDWGTRSAIAMLHRYSTESQNGTPERRRDNLAVLCEMRLGSAAQPIPTIRITLRQVMDLSRSTALSISRIKGMAN